MRELPQEVRDRVGTRLLRLTLKELFEWRFMQVRPGGGGALPTWWPPSLALPHQHTPARPATRMACRVPCPFKDPTGLLPPCLSHSYRPS